VGLTHNIKQNGRRCLQWPVKVKAVAKAAVKKAKAARAVAANNYPTAEV